MNDEKCISYTNTHSSRLNGKLDGYKEIEKHTFKPNKKKHCQKKGIPGIELLCKINKYVLLIIASCLDALQIVYRSDARSYQYLLKINHLSCLWQSITKRAKNDQIKFKTFTIWLKRHFGHLNLL